MSIITRELGVRECAYPFDWCVSEIDGLINCLNNKFEDYLDYNNFSLIGHTHPNLKDKYFPYQKKYKIKFWHENYVEKVNQSINGEEWENLYAKYNKRIKRFLDINNIENRLVVFLRYESGHNEKYELSKVYQLFEALKNNFNNIEFKFIHIFVKDKFNVEYLNKNRLILYEIDKKSINKPYDDVRLALDHFIKREKNENI